MRSFSGLILRWGMFALTCAVLAFWILTEFREVDYRDAWHSRCIVEVRASEGKIVAKITYGPQSEIWKKSTEIKDGRPERFQFLRFWSNHDLHDKFGLVMPSFDPPRTSRTVPPLKDPAILLPVWIIFVPLLTASALCVYSGMKKYKRGHCYFCGYNLTGNTSGHCPECGQRIAKGFARFLRPLILFRSFVLAPPRTWLTRLGIIAMAVGASNAGYHYFENSNLYVWACSDCPTRIETLTTSPMKRVCGDYWIPQGPHDHHWQLDRPWMEPWMFWSWVNRWADQPPSIESILKSDPAEFKSGRGSQWVAQFDPGPFGDLMRKAWPELQLQTIKRRR